MANYLQTQADLEEHLRDTVQGLEISAQAFDQGYEGEAKRLAAAIRVMVHDTSKSMSLLSQLGKKSARFLDTSVSNPEGNLFTYAGITAMLVGGDAAVHVAPLDKLPPEERPRLVEFDEWWNRVIFIDDQKRQTTRKDLVLAVANKDGGAHVDPQLDEKYANLSRRNSLAWHYAGPRGAVPMEGPELAAIRQITHEPLKSLNPSMPRVEPEIGDGLALFMGGSATIGHPPVPKVGRNDLCPCGSGKKYKRCYLAQR